jgi:hypothetical protein
MAVCDYRLGGPAAPVTINIDHLAARATEVTVFRDVPKLLGIQVPYCARSASCPIFIDLMQRRGPFAYVVFDVLNGKDVGAFRSWSASGSSAPS